MALHLQSSCTTWGLQENLRAPGWPLWELGRTQSTVAGRSSVVYIYYFCLWILNLLPCITPAIHIFRVSNEKLRTREVPATSCSWEACSLKMLIIQGVTWMSVIWLLYFFFKDMWLNTVLSRENIFWVELCLWLWSQISEIAVLGSQNLELEGNLQVI